MSAFPPIIALTGAPSSGQSTIGKYIVNRLSRRGIPCQLMTHIESADEAKAIRSSGGVVVRVVRPGHVLPPEHSAIAPDFELHNQGDLYALALACDSLLTTIANVTNVELEA